MRSVSQWRLMWAQPGTVCASSLKSIVLRFPVGDHDRPEESKCHALTHRSILNEGGPNSTGAHVTQIFPGGPAARAGIHLGDVITQINQQPVAGAAGAVMTLREFQPQAEIELSIRRDQEELQIPVVLGSRRSSGYLLLLRTRLNSFPTTVVITITTPHPITTTATTAQRIIPSGGRWESTWGR